MLKTFPVLCVDLWAFSKLIYLSIRFNVNIKVNNPNVLLIGLSDWVSNLLLLICSHIIARTNYFLMKWWYLLCTRPTRLVGFFIVRMSISNLVHAMRFWHSTGRLIVRFWIFKSIKSLTLTWLLVKWNFKLFESKKTKGLKEDSQTRLKHKSTCKHVNPLINIILTPNQHVCFYFFNNAG